MSPFHIKSQTLRQAQLDPGTALGVFSRRPEDLSEPDKESKKAGSDKRPGWKQADVKRAIAAAEQAGLETYRIEIYPDCTIAIVVGDPAQSSPRPENHAAPSQT